MKKDAKWIILILGITYILLFKLFNNPRFYGHDTIFHAGSIIYMSQNISLKYLFGKNIIKLKYNNSFRIYFLIIQIQILLFFY